MIVAKVYPTLIDAYEYWLKSDAPLQDFIDRINRVPTEMPEAAMKGTAYNDMIDAMLEGKDVETAIHIVRNVPNDVYKWTHVYDLPDGDNQNAVEFMFPKKITDEIIRKLQGAVAQVYNEATIKTAFGDVVLYGYVDYVLRDTLIDLKTTSRYDFPKYLNSAQHPLYLYTARQNMDVENFKYLVTDMRNIYEEAYHWNVNLEKMLVSMLNNLVSFIYDHKDMITNDKIFGLEPDKL